MSSEEQIPNPETEITPNEPVEALEPPTTAEAPINPPADPTPEETIEQEVPIPQETIAPTDAPASQDIPPTEPVAIEPERVIPEPQPVISEPQPVVTEPEPMIEEPKPQIADPEAMIVEPAPTVAQPPASEEAKPVSTAPTPGRKRLKKISAVRETESPKKKTETPPKGFIDDRRIRDELHSSDESAHESESDKDAKLPQKRARQDRTPSPKKKKESSDSEEEPVESGPPLVGKAALEAKRKAGLIESKFKPIPKINQKKKTPEKAPAKSKASPDKPKSKPKPKESKPKPAAKPKAKPSSTPAPVKKAKVEKPYNSGEREKTELITKILIRWWYALPDWPPADYVYDTTPYGKVQAVTGYPGLYTNIQQEVIDLRPQDSCPSFNNLFKKSQNELKQLLVTALDSQIEELMGISGYDQILEQKLKKEVAYYRKRLPTAGKTEV